MLSQRHGCRVSRETLRQWMIAEGLWLDRRRRLPSVHQPRNRRARVGERVMLHEGAKAAMAAERIATDPESDHPWREELEKWEHWGMLAKGGSLMPI